MSEWQTPTERAATSTSSSAICRHRQLDDLGPALRRVLQRPHRAPPRCASTSTLTWSPVGDRSTSKPRSTTSAIGTCAVTTFSTGQPAAGDEVDDPRPVGDRVAPGADQRDVVLGELHRLDRRGLRVQAGLRDPAGRADRRRSPSAGRRSLPEHSMTASAPMPSVRSLSHSHDVDLRGVEHLADVEARGQLGPDRVHLGDHHAGAQLGRVQRRQRADRVRHR